jgi:hypothetical protein
VHYESASYLQVGYVVLLFFNLTCSCSTVAFILLYLRISYLIHVLRVCVHGYCSALHNNILVCCALLVPTQTLPQT